MQTFQTLESDFKSRWRPCFVVVVAVVVVVVLTVVVFVLLRELSRWAKAVRIGKALRLAQIQYRR